jgi:hypothetical protein
MGPALKEVSMRLCSRIGAVSLAVALSLSGTAQVLADETPKAPQNAESAQYNAATLNVEGMT